MAFKKFILALAYATSSVVAFSGDATYYTPGVGACGENNGPSDHVVALPVSQYGNCPNPNDCPSCKKSINIHYKGKTVTAAVKDKCPGCSGDSIDLSPAVFEQLEKLDVGRIQVTWDYA
ncbi:hypothetical protein MGN70_002243 [Eutypa lata]|nr:hypothetical protein MGN70_002243 [Eutypa lata]